VRLTGGADDGDGVMRERECGTACANSTILMKLAYIRLCLYIPATKLGNLATRTHTALTDCFSVIDWRLQWKQWRVREHVSMRFY